MLIQATYPGTIVPFLVQPAATWAGLLATFVGGVIGLLLAWLSMVVLDRIGARR